MLIKSLSFLFTVSSLFGQDYAWPIRASQSLSATFCEYRDGHLHAGIDIKTWGEMEVPCLAIDDGYIEKVIISYHGYGRGLFLRTRHGHTVVYGHLERFLPDMERLIEDKQRDLDRYELRLVFQPGDFPVKKGQRLAYSGTSGTEYPHLHFEIRDTSGTALNPQHFYPLIKDTVPPKLDEFLLLPGDGNSRINGSRQPQIVDPGTVKAPIRFQGAVKVAVNAHDRKDGTLNKYNFYQADLFLNDSLVFEQSFDALPLALSDNVALVYPGIKGRRGWRFMALYATQDSIRLPFAREDMVGHLRPSGLSRLRVRVADIKGNEEAAEILLRQQTAASWEVLREHGQLIIVRHYPQHGYERFQFYTGDDTYVPITQTLHTLSTTRWYLPEDPFPLGVRALGALNSEIKWVLSPQVQQDRTLEIQWHAYEDQFYFSVHDSQARVYPLAFALEHLEGTFSGELIQISESAAESDLVPLDVMATATRLTLLNAQDTSAILDLEPLKRLDASASCALELDSAGFSLRGFNRGSTPIYLACDTLISEFAGKKVNGVRIQILGTVADFSGSIQYHKPDSTCNYGFYAPDKRKSWKLLSASDSAGLLSRSLDQGGTYFVLNDTEAPQVTDLTGTSGIRPGQRLLYRIEENTGKLAGLRSSLSARLDGVSFFPDYNPLRQELSFHVPDGFSPGTHSFELSVTDAAGNQRNFVQTFIVK